ncbi:unnamed protein product [Chrysodeixis includens]|uniref:Uncharacterized protein n=1 Tax=Chrysodeixis includens TaxID=689277 RepID=A0A9N8PZP2_CHRIL|nr:unnamed protein product [Chrysodeixis includens]
MTICSNSRESCYTNCTSINTYMPMFYTKLSRLLFIDNICPMIFDNNSLISFSLTKGVKVKTRFNNKTRNQYCLKRVLIMIQVVSKFQINSDLCFNFYPFFP